MTHEQFEKKSTPHNARVSVIVTSYNKAPYLQECLESVIHQTYQNFEIIVVNDGSEDTTSEVVRNLIRLHPQAHVSLFEKQNGGVSDARNYGLSRSTGTFVMVLDGDDKVMPNYLERAVDALISQCGQIFRPNQQNFGGASDQWTPNPYDPYTIRYDNCIPTPSLFDRRLFERTKGYNVALSFCEDWEFWVKCSKLKPRVVQSNEFLTCWRSTDHGLHAEGVQGRWQEAFASVAILNEDCYPIQEILSAHGCVPSFPASHLQRFKKLDSIHPKEWFLKFIFGLLAEHDGEIERGIELYCQAQELCGDQEWQPYFRLGHMSQLIGKRLEAIAFFHEVRLRRPDMGVVVNPLINELSR